MKADAGAPQRGQVAADAEGGTEVAGEGADIRPGGHVDLDVDIEEPYAVHLHRAPLADREPRHRHLARREGDILAAADPGVGALPSTLIALTALGTWAIAPVRPVTAASSLPGARSTAVVAVIAPSASSVTVVAPRRMVAA